VYKHAQLLRKVHLGPTFEPAVVSDVILPQFLNQKQLADFLFRGLSLDGIIDAFGVTGSFCFELFLAIDVGAPFGQLAALSHSEHLAFAQFA